MSVYLPRSAVSADDSRPSLRRASTSAVPNGAVERTARVRPRRLAHAERAAALTPQPRPPPARAASASHSSASTRMKCARWRALQASARPRPGIVRSTIVFGLAVARRARPRKRVDDGLPCRCRRSRCVSQPKARHLSATGSISTTIGPSAWMPLQSTSATRLSSPKLERRHRRLPGRALLHLAVGDLAEDPRVATRRGAGPAPCRPPGRGRGRASRRSSRRRACVRACSFRAGFHPRRRWQLGHRDDAGLGEHRPQRDRVVARREQESVALGPLRIRRVVPHLVRSRARRGRRRCRDPGRCSPGPCRLASRTISRRSIAVARAARPKIGLVRGLVDERAWPQSLSRPPVTLSRSAVM